MKKEPVRRLGTKRGLMTAALALGFGLWAGSAIAAESLNPDADEILRSMSTFLAGTKAFSVSADISNEVITLDAQKLQLNGHATLVVERPSRFYATRKGRFADAELIFDGSKLTVYGKTVNGYVQKDLAGTIDQAISALESGSGLRLSAAIAGPAQRPRPSASAAATRPCLMPCRLTGFCIMRSPFLPGDCLPSV